MLHFILALLHLYLYCDSFNYDALSVVFYFVNKKKGRKRNNCQQKLSFSSLDSRLPEREYN